MNSDNVKRNYSVKDGGLFSDEGSMKGEIALCLRINKIFTIFPPTLDRMVENIQKSYDNGYYWTYMNNIQENYLLTHKEIMKERYDKRRETPIKYNKAPKEPVIKPAKEPKVKIQKEKVLKEPRIKKEKVVKKYDRNYEQEEITRKIRFIYEKTGNQITREEALRLISTKKEQQKLKKDKKENTSLFKKLVKDKRIEFSELLKDKSEGLYALNIYSNELLRFEGYTEASKHFNVIRQVIYNCDTRSNVLQKKYLIIFVEK